MANKSFNCQYDLSARENVKSFTQFGFTQQVDRPVKRWFSFITQLYP